MTPRLEEPAPTRIQHHLGVDIGLDIICRVARLCPERDRRAMIWLSNYARLRRSNPDEVAATLNLDKRAVRSALTDVGEDRTAFVAAVEQLRAQWESSLPTLVDTSVSRVTREAFTYAAEETSIVECVGPSRMGKSVVIESEWHRHLDHAVYVSCPTGHGERELLNEIALALGVSVDPSKSGQRMRMHIESCFAPELISLLIVDEGHYLWPRDPRERQPKRIEYLRTRIFRDGKGASVLVVATPQFSLSLLASLDNNPRWSPDQWYGRRLPFYTPETMREKELRDIAVHHAPEFAPPLIDMLVEQAMASEGFAGLVVNTIKLARKRAAREKATMVTEEILVAAQAQMARGSRLEQMMKEQAAQAVPPSPKPRPAAPKPAPVPRLNGHGHAPAAPVAINPATVRV